MYIFVGQFIRRIKFALVYLFIFLFAEFLFGALSDVGVQVHRSTPNEWKWPATFVRNGNYWKSSYGCHQMKRKRFVPRSPGWIVQRRENRQSSFSSWSASANFLAEKSITTHPRIRSGPVRVRGSHARTFVPLGGSGDSSCKSVTQKLKLSSSTVARWSPKGIPASHL